VNDDLTTTSDPHGTTRSDDAVPAGGPGRSRLLTAAAGAGLGITAVVGLAVGASGLAGAADDTTDTVQTEDAPSEEAGGEATDGAIERGEHLAEALAPLVEDGTLTQAQADAVADRLHEAWADRPGRGVGPGPGGEAVAEILGMTTDELREALQAGTTLAELAEQQGVAIDALVDAMLAGMEERLAERVADGTITQEQADERLAEATERVTAHVNGEGGGMGRGPGRGERWGA
jgi:hypothetical protein